LPVLEAFRTHFLEAFEGTYEIPSDYYLDCKIARDMIAGTTSLCQKHYAEEILRSHRFLGQSTLQRTHGTILAFQTTVATSTPTCLTEIFEDNLVCIEMSETPVRCKFSHHIDIR